MSLILDALNKIDRQRDNDDAIPHLGSHHQQIQTRQANAISPWIVAAIIAVLLAIIAALLVVLIRTPQVNPPLAPQPLVKIPELQTGLNEPKAQHSQEVVSSTQPSLGESTKFAEQNVQQTISPTSVEYSEPKEISPAERDGDANPVEDEAINQEIADLYSPVNAQPALPNGKNKAANTAKAQPSTTTSGELLVSEEELQALWLETANEIEDIPIPQPVDPYISLPFLYQLPESFKERIPTLMYQHHIYSERASAVILNGETYKKGDVIAADLVVTDITEQELILSYLNKPFKLAALSSWVQMN